MHVRMHTEEATGRSELLGQLFRDAVERILPEGGSADPDLIRMVFPHTDGAIVVTLPVGAENVQGRHSVRQIWNQWPPRSVLAHPPLMAPVPEQARAYI